MSSVVAPVQVQFRTEGVEAVKRATDEVARSVARSTREAATGGAQTSAVIGRIGSQARTAASGLEAMARTGQASGESMKILASSGAELAFMMGPHGALVGALAIAGIAIFEHFKRIRDQIAETRKKAQEEVAAMLNAGNFQGIKERFRDLEQGTPGAGYADGITAREAALARLRERFNQTWNPIELANLRRDIKKAEQELAPLVEERERLRDLILNPPAAVRQTGTLPAVTSTARAPGAKPKTAKDPKSLFELYPDAPSASSIAAAVVDKYTGGSLARGADKVTREAVSGMAGDTAAAVAASVRSAVDAGKSAVGAAIQDYKQEIARRTQEVAAFVQGGISNVIGSAINQGFREAFSGKGLGGAIKGFLKTALAGIGAMLQQIGTAYLAGAKLLAGIQRWLVANPSLAIGASIALIALGAAIQAGAESIGAGGGGYGGGGSGYSAAAAGNVIDRGYINPANPLLGANRVTPAQPVTNYVTVIGANDHGAQRGLSELMANGRARGLTY